MAIENLEETPEPRSRARAIQITRMSKYEIQRGSAETPPEVNELYNYPRTRGDCLQGEHQQRPCPFVSCKHHLYLDVSDVGNIKLNHPDIGPESMDETCTLDIADKGGLTLEEVGAFFGVTRERIRQIEAQALRKLKRLPMADKRALIDLLERDVSTSAEGCSHVSAKHAGP